MSYGSNGSAEFQALKEQFDALSPAEQARVRANAVKMGYVRDQEQSQQEADDYKDSVHRRRQSSPHNGKLRD